MYGQSGGSDEGGDGWDEQKEPEADLCRSRDRGDRPSELHQIDDDLDGAVEVAPGWGERKAAPAAQFEERVRDHAPPHGSWSRSRDVDQVRRQASSQPDGEPMSEPAGGFPAEGEEREPECEHDIESEQQREADEDAAEQRKPLRPARLDRIT